MNRIKSVYFFKIRNFFKLLIKYIHNLIDGKKPLCHIEEIDIPKKTAIISCRGIFKTHVKLEFNEIISDSDILSNLSSIHAAWIGYYYGISGNEFKNKHCYQQSIEEDTSLEENIAECSVLSLNRRGYILYLDKASGIAHSSLPIKMLENKKLLKKFSPNQACYIGVFGGVSILKNKKRGIYYGGNKPNLRIVK